MTNALEILKKAIDNARGSVETGKYYYDMMCQRLEGNDIDAGSYYKGVDTIDGLMDLLLSGEYIIESGSVESGLIILKSNSFEGFENIIPFEQVNPNDIVFIEHHEMHGCNQQAIRVDSIDAFLPTNESHFIISTKNIITSEIGLEHAFLITHSPGRYIQKYETLFGGPYVVMISL